MLEGGKLLMLERVMKEDSEWRLIRNKNELVLLFDLKDNVSYSVYFIAKTFRFPYINNDVFPLYT